MKTQNLPCGATAQPRDDNQEGSGVDRRTFLERSVALAALAALAGACSSPLGIDLSGPVTVNLDQYPELAQAGGVARVRESNVAIALVNLGGGTFVALSLICPHQGGAISWYGDAFICPVHGATFAEDGHWIGGQPTGHMREYSTSYDPASGTVTIST